MRKKILVPVMALAMIVTAGVNCGMISSYTNNSNISLASFIKMSIAQAESVCGNCGKDYCPVCSGVGQFIGDDSESDDFIPDDYAQYETGWGGCQNCGATYRFCVYSDSGSCTTPEELGCVCGCD